METRTRRSIPTSHLVLGHAARYVSLKERGLGFESRMAESSLPYLLRPQSYRLQDEDPELIYSYSRSQALADGVLIDVTDMAKEVGFKVHSAITANLHQRLQPREWEQEKGEDYDGRLWDVLWMGSLAARKARREPGPNDLVKFEVVLTEWKDPAEHPVVRRLVLWCMVGPGDEAEPVITIGFPEDF